MPHSHTCLQLFITVMDKLRLEIRAMDEVWLLGRAGWVGGLGAPAVGGREQAWHTAGDRGWFQCSLVHRSSLTCGS